MADISTELTALMNAVYGEEVRSAFRDALLKMNNDVIGLITREDLYQMTQEEFTALKTSLINQINAAAATARETIPEDYSALSDTVAKLLDASYPNIMWQAGSLSDTGSDQSSDYICRSNFIPVTNILGDDIKSKLNVSVTGDYKVEVYKQLLYDRDKNFIRIITRNQIYPISYSTTENMPYGTGTCDGYVRLVAGCVDDNNQPVSHVTYPAVFTELKESLKVYTTLLWLWDGIEELETDLDEKITNLKADLSKAVSEQANYSASTYETGYINVSDGVGTTIDFSSVVLNGQYRYKIITVTAGDEITVTGKGANAPRLWCFLDTNKVITSVSESALKATDLLLMADADGYFITQTENGVTHEFGVKHVYKAVNAEPGEVNAGKFLSVDDNGNTVWKELYVAHDLDFIRGKWSNTGKLIYSSVPMSSRKIIHIKKGSIIKKKIGVSGSVYVDIYRFSSDGSFDNMSSYTDTFTAASDMYVGISLYYSETGTTSAYSTLNFANLYSIFDINLYLFEPVELNHHFAFAGFTEYVNNMAMEEIQSWRSMPSSQASTIVTKNKKCIGIDFARNDTQFNAFKLYMSQFYAFECIGKLDYIIISHYHSDHYGCLKSLVEDYGVVIDNAIAFLPDLLTEENISQLTEVTQAEVMAGQTEILNLLNEHNCTIIRPSEGQKYVIDGLQFRFYNTSIDPYIEEGGDFYSINYNDWSLCQQIKCGDTVINMSADIGTKAQTMFGGKLLPCDILTAPHHGWDNGVNNLIPTFINNVSPKVVISQNGSEQKGSGNASIMNASSPMQSWCEANGVPNYCTFNNGTIDMTINENGYSFDRPCTRYIRNNKNWSYTDNSEHIES